MDYNYKTEEHYWISFLSNQGPCFDISRINWIHFLLLLLSPGIIVIIYRDHLDNTLSYIVWNLLPSIVVIIIVYCCKKNKIRGRLIRTCYGSVRRIESSTIACKYICISYCGDIKWSPSVPFNWLIVFRLVCLFGWLLVYKAVIVISSPCWRSSTRGRSLFARHQTWP